MTSGPSGARARRAGLAALAAAGISAALALAAGCASPGPSRSGDQAGPPPLRLDGLRLRVLLRMGPDGLRASAPGGLKLEAPDGTVLAELPATARAGLEARGGQIALNGEGLHASRAWVLPLRPGEAVRVEGRRYRGGLLLEALAGRLALVNVVGLEDYLRGVLPREVEARGPMEALEAQAVAARSFAVWELGRSAGKAWDLDDSSDSQVYGSREAERPATDRAVRETRGQVLAWKGRVARTYFHSNSGGATANAGEVWGSGAPTPPYLRGVDDPWSEGGPHYRWKWSVPLEEAGQRLRAAGLLKGGLRAVRPGARSWNGRWRTLVLVDDSGRTHKVGANAFREALGPDRLRSTHFSLADRDGILEFRGRGWGHGVGLSQEGAFAQARAGWDYRAILYFYYPGTTLATLRE